MSDEQNRLCIRSTNSKGTRLEDCVRTAPRQVFSDDAIRLIRQLIREEIAAAKVMPEVRVTLERAEDGILERITRTSGEVTDRFRLQR